VVVPVLYSSSHDAHSLRARLAFLYARLRCEVREIDPACPLPTVPHLPLLQLPGRLIDDSMEIVRWAIARRPGLTLWPDSRVRQQSIDNLIATVDGPFFEATQAYAKAAALPGRNRDHARMQAEIFLAQLEARIARMGFLVGDEETLADIAVLPFVYCFAEVDRDWFERSPYLALRQWLDRYQYNPTWMQCLEPIPLWHPGDEPYYLLAPDLENGIPTLSQRA
jgi:glutathione S-transferase